MKTHLKTTQQLMITISVVLAQY